MPILLIIIIGVAAGFVATRIMRLDTNIITTIAFGFIGAVAGAVLLIWAWNTYIK